MGGVSKPDVTRLLNEAPTQLGEPSEELLTLVYKQLRKIAQQHMNGERGAQTLQATALVHEAYLRLLGGAHVRWEGRAHFFAAAAEAMRRILVERARRRAAARYGGGRRRVELDENIMASPDRDGEVIAVGEVLDKLAAEDPRKAQLVKLRYFAGMTIVEAAEVMGISHATAERYWAYSRLKLYEWMEAQGPTRRDSENHSNA